MEGERRGEERRGEQRGADERRGCPGNVVHLVECLPRIQEALSSPTTHNKLIYYST